MAKIASNQVIKSLNGLRDSVTIPGDSGISFTPSGNTLTISLTNTPSRKFVVGGLSGGFRYDVPHNLITVDVIVQVYNSDGGLLTVDSAFDPNKNEVFARVINANTVRIGIYGAGTYRVTVIG